MIQVDTPLSGFADHGVSEAIYLQDPDGNGIEIYRDRPRDAWPKGEGGLDMVTAPLQTQALLNLVEEDPSSWENLPEATRLGHVHLKVHDISSAEDFYQQVLGMDLMQRYGKAASFFSDHVYHHHIGANTWNSRGASPPPEGALGLGWVTFNRHPAMELNAVKEATPPSYVQHEGPMLQDPAGNLILINEG